MGRSATPVAVQPDGAPGSTLAAVEQHTTIFEAIRDSDPERAAEAARAHVDSVFTAYEREAQRRLLGESEVEEENYKNQRPMWGLPRFHAT